MTSTTPHRAEHKHWASFITSVLLAAILTFGPLVLGGFRIWLVLPTLTAIWLVVIFQGARLLWNGPQLVGRFGDWIDAFAALFLAYATYRYFTTPVEFLARLEVLQIYSYAAIFWICRYGLSRKPHALYLLAALVVVGLIVAGSGYVFRLKPEWRPFAPELLTHYAPRFCGTYGCPNHFGALVVMTAGILLSFCLLYRIPWTLRIIGFYLAGMMLASAALSMSRGTWFGMTASLLVLALFLARHGYMRWYWPVIGLTIVGLAAGAFFYLSPVAQDRVRDMYTQTQQGNFENYVRVELARDAIKIWKDYPLLGTGPATFIHVHMRYQSPTYSTLAQYTHDDYLNLLADYGLIGLLIALAFIIAVTRQLFTHLGPLPDTDESMLRLSALCAWCALLIHSFVDFNMHIPANAYVLFGLVGLGLRRSAARADTETGWLPKAAFARIVGALIILASVVLLWVTLTTARGYFPYFFADRDYDTEPVPAAFVAGQKAVDADPRSPLALKYLGDLYRNRAANEPDLAKRTPDARQAAALYARAFAVNPLNDELLALQGLSYDLMARYPEAYFIHTTVIKKQPYNGYFRLLLGLHFWRRGMLNEARKSFEIGARCPHGNDDNVKALAEINRILGEPKPPMIEHDPTMP